MCCWESWISQHTSSFPKVHDLRKLLRVLPSPYFYCITTDLIKINHISKYFPNILPSLIKGIFREALSVALYCIWLNNGSRKTRHDMSFINKLPFSLIVSTWPLVSAFSLVMYFRFLKFLPGRCCGAWSSLWYLPLLFFLCFSAFQTRWAPKRSEDSLKQTGRPGLRISASLDLEVKSVYLHFWQVVRLCQCYCL